MLQKSATRDSAQPGLIRICLFSLLVLLMACLTAAAADTDFRATYQQFTQAWQDQHWDEALGLALQLDELRPDNARVQYNVASAWAMKGDPDEALSWLKKAAQSGFTDARALESDTDFNTLHSRPGWPVVVGAVRENQLRRRSRISQVFATLPLPIELPKGWDETTPAPLIIALHGYGGRADNFPKLWRRAANRPGG